MLGGTSRAAKLDPEEESLTARNHSPAPWITMTARERLDIKAAYPEAGTN